MATSENTGEGSSKTAFKVCSNCGTDCPEAALKCESCGKPRFEPVYVKAHRPINRQLAVQITSTNPQFGPVEERITLSKWWPGDHAIFHIPNSDQWTRIENIIDRDLGPKLGWKAQNMVEVARTAANGQNGSLSIGSELGNFIKRIVSGVDPNKFSKQDFNSFIDTLGTVADVFSNANAGFRDTFLAIVRRLPNEKQRALEDLDILLRGWSLNVITNVAQQVKTRLDTITLFEERITDPRVFEIRGENSIHRILERSMWLIDEHYWLLHSNTSLRVSIGEEMAKRDRKKFGMKRPDFVCGTVGDRLIILELKRPGKRLSVRDLDQLETYLTIAEQYFKSTSSRGYLIGSKFDEELKRHLKYRSGFEVLFYANILDGTKKRYNEFLKSIDRNDQ